jgi:hypothetical protein
MKILFLSLYLLLFSILSPVGISNTLAQSTSPANTNLTMFGRGLYPGDDETFQQLKASGFTTIILSSFYIHADGDVYSGDDKNNPIIHDGQYVGDKEWLKRVAALKQSPTSITRIEFLLEGRWFNQPPSTFDFIQDWLDTTKVLPSIVSGTGMNSTLYKITKVLKDAIGVDAICIDDESVYNSTSIIRYGEMISKLNMRMTLCPFKNPTYWKDVITGSQRGLIDAIYLQCYDGGRRNTPGQWQKNLATNIPVYPIFLCRGAFSTCSTTHNSLTTDEIKNTMLRFKQDYPEMTGAAIWQMADVKNYISMDCAGQYPESGKASTVSEYLNQLKNSLQEGL